MFIRVLHMFCAVELIQYTQGNNHLKILPKKAPSWLYFFEFYKLFTKTVWKNASGELFQRSVVTATENLFRKQLTHLKLDIAANITWSFSIEIFLKNLSHMLFFVWVPSCD